jgi:hypothetical protein
MTKAPLLDTANDTSGQIACFKGRRQFGFAGPVEWFRRIVEPPRTVAEMTFPQRSRQIDRRCRPIES